MLESLCHPNKSITTYYEYYNKFGVFEKKRIVYNYGNELTSAAVAFDEYGYPNYTITDNKYPEYKSTGTMGDIQYNRYDFDTERGNLLLRSNYRGGELRIEESFAYDGLDRLTPLWRKSF